MNRNTDIEDLLADYFARGLQKEELETLREWLDESTDNKKRFMALQEIWFSASFTDDKNRYDPQEAFRDFLSRTRSANVIRNRKTLKQSWRGIAASVAILFIVLGGFFYIGNKNTVVLSENIVEVPHGSRTKLTLPDNSNVWLNAGSTFTYPHTFGKKERTVFLSGEGYFEVARDEKRGFTVGSTEIEVNVLGTKFNFRNYPDENIAMIDLFEGSVSVFNPVDGLSGNLSPGERATLDKTTGSMIISVSGADNSAQWVEGIITFDEEPLGEILKVLERNYGVKITLTEERLKDLRFYGRFDSSRQNIEKVLDILALTHRIQYTINGDEVTISPK